MAVETHDFVVVGGGSTGCVVATRLAQAGATVLLLEAGPPDKGLAFKIPANVAKAYTSANWDHTAEPDPSREGLVESWPAGKVLGGGGSVNSMVYTRGHRADYDGWAQLGGEGWHHQAVLPCFKRMETWQRGANEWRGGDGPIHVTEQSYRHVGNDMFLESAQRAGHQRNDDYNGDGLEGVGITQVNQKRGFRSHSAQAYVRDLAPKTLRVLTSACALRILFEGDRAIGVEYRHEGATKRVHARNEVIVSAGAITTPKLLLLSGIGPRQELDDHGIGVVGHSPGVGHNLQVHPSLVLHWPSTVPTLNRATLATKLKAGLRFARDGGGPLATTYYHVLVFHKTRPSLEKPDIQIGFTPFAIGRRSVAAGQQQVGLSPDCGFVVTVHLLSGRNRGQIGLRSGRPDDHPRIEHQVLGDPDDLDDLLAGAAEARRIMAQAPMSDLVSPAFSPEAECSTEEQWRDYARRNTFSSHPVGTCKMGSDDMAVVDAQLRVRGVRNLRVIDASIMPTITTGNTNAPAMMIGERGAELVLAR